MNIILELQSNVGLDNFCKWIISNIIFSIAFSCLEVYIFKNLFKIKTDKNSLINFIIANVITRTLSIFFVPLSYTRFINSISTILFIEIFLKKQIEKALIYESINIVFKIFSELLFYQLFVPRFLNLNSYEEVFYGLNSNIFRLTFLLAIKTLAYIILRCGKVELELVKRTKFKYKAMSVANWIVGMLLIFNLISKIETMPIGGETNFRLMWLAVMNLYFAVSIMYIIRLLKCEKEKIEFENLESYNKTLSIMYDNLRGFKHDFSNFVQSLDGYVQTNDINGIKSMSVSVCRDCRDITNMGILDPNIINNPAVYSLLTNKYFMARNKNIIMNIEITLDLEKIDIDYYDLCGIMGILLDNSIEAAEECENKIVNVRLIKEFGTNKKVIIIENSYNNLDVNPELIFEKGYSTKGDKKEHGLGLWNVKKLLKNSNNLRLYTNKGKLFLQKIEIIE